MIYELRIYRCVPGRMPALLSRDAADLGEARHPPGPGFGPRCFIRVIEIVHMLAWDSMAEREQALGRI